MSLGVIKSTHDEPIEIIIHSLQFNNNNIYVSRHGPNGDLIEDPRIFYAQMKNIESFKYVFIPESKQTIAFNIYDKRVFFITPSKEVNWARGIDLDSLFSKSDQEPVFFLGFHKQGDILVALIRDRDKCYAIDAESRFYLWDNDNILLSSKKEPLPYLIIPQESPQHELITVVTNGSQNRLKLLAVHARNLQTKDLSYEEWQQAGKIFLPPSSYEDCEDDRAFEFRPDVSIKEQIKKYCADNKQSCPENLTIKVIEKDFPKFYKILEKNANEAFLRCVRISLTQVLWQEDYTFDDIGINTYTNVSDYRNWIQSIVFSSDITLTVFNHIGEKLSKARIQGWALSNEESLLSTDNIIFNQNIDKNFVVAALRQQGLETKGELGYYMISW